MLRALTLYSHRFDSAANIVQRLDVFHRQCIVRGTYRLIHIVRVELIDRLRQRRRVTLSASHQHLEVLGMHCVIHCACRLPQCVNTSALAAEGKHVHAAQRRYNTDRAPGESLRRTQAVFHRKFQYQVGAVFKRGTGTAEFIVHRHVAALGEIAAHHRNDVCGA